MRSTPRIMARSTIWNTQNLAFERKKYILRRGSYSVHIILLHYRCGTAMIHLCKVSQYPFTSRAQVLFVAFLLVLSAQVVVAQGTGAAWRYLGPDGASVTHIAASNDTLYAATDGGSVFRSTNGITWMPLSAFGTYARALSAAQGRVITTYYPRDFASGTVFTFSTTGGISSVSSTKDYWYDAPPTQMALNGSKIIAVSRMGIAIGDFPQMQNYRVVFTSATITCVAGGDNTIYAGSKGFQLLRSRNGGSTWLGISLPFEPEALTVVNATTLFASSTNAVYFSQDGGLFWQQTGAVPTGTTIRGLTIAQGRLYAGTNKGAFRSTDSGKTWQSVNEGLSARYISNIVAHDSAVFIYVNDAENWQTRHLYQVVNKEFIPFKLGQDTLPSLLTTPTFLFAFSERNLWRSRNGKDWLLLGQLPKDVGFGYIVAYDNNRTYYASTTDGVYRSLDSGRSWQLAWLKGENVYNFGMTGDSLYAFIIDKVSSTSYRHVTKFSVDGGKVWSLPIIGYDNLPIGMITPFLNSLYIITRTIYQCIDRCNYQPNPILWRLQGGFVPRGGVWGEGILPYDFVSTRRNEILSASSQYGIVRGSSDGKQWNTYTTNGLTNTNISAFAVNNQAIYIGTGSGLYILDAPVTTVAVRETTLLAESSWSISPNPTNGHITIHLTLPKTARVRCTLHNALGQEVALLADSEVSAGARDISTTVGNLPQGLYICRVAVSGETQTSKSIIISR